MPLHFGVACYTVLDKRNRDTQIVETLESTFHITTNGKDGVEGGRTMGRKTRSEVYTVIHMSVGGHIEAVMRQEMGATLRQWQ